MHENLFASRFISGSIASILETPNFQFNDCLKMLSVSTLICIRPSTINNMNGLIRNILLALLICSMIIFLSWMWTLLSRFPFQLCTNTPFHLCLLFFSSCRFFMIDRCTPMFDCIIVPFISIVSFFLTGPTFQFGATSFDMFSLRSTWQLDRST